MNDDSPAPTNPPRNLMLLIALTQGFALLLLWRALTNETWPATQPAVNIPLWTVAVTYPALLLLSLESGRVMRTVILVSLFAAVLILPSVYIGWQASPYGEFPIESLIFVYVVTLGVACFKGLMYLQHYVAQAPIAYGTLFRYSWRNALVVGLTAPLVWGVALILFLWGALFEAIGIDFFADLFARDWFLFPVLAVVFGLGVLIFRRLAMVIDGITSLLEGLIRLLFPLVISVVAIFLATLPFTGLQPLWETGNGTALLMGINIIALFFANAVYQPGRRPPYPLIVHRLLYGGACLLPIVSVLAFYGLYLRIAQYGWTVERCWALALCCLMALFSVGYAVGIIRRRDDWPETLGRVNKAMGWVILALTLLVNTPLLDFRSISLASQFARVDRGEIEIYDFDFFYARQYLARPAWLRTRALLDEIGESDERLAELIRDPRPQRVPITNAEELWERVVYRPESFEVPEDLRPLIESSYAAPYDNLVLVAVDLNQDQALEYVLIGSTGFGVLWAEGFYRQEEEWLSLNVRRTAAEPSGNDLEQSLLSGEIEAVPPEFQDLLIGDVELSFMPR
ncbi:MAG: DUF4153 domain-containing protein [Rhodospirillaceae bacterium]|nr:DUF4153 domain-containing protein [Rhodospirillaceae bacterium]MDE0000736.1 DUF4153 domain-containing protein [Rhodospirillaceae bacterium]